MRYLVTTVKNPGGFQVRVEPNSSDPNGEVEYVKLFPAPDAVEFADDVAQNLLNIYSKVVEEFFPAPTEAEPAGDDVVVAKVKRVGAKLFGRS